MGKVLGGGGGAEAYSYVIHVLMWCGGRFYHCQHVLLITTGKFATCFDQILINCICSCTTEAELTKRCLILETEGVNYN